ncbi:hypothetical protein [Nonomuraea soli]|uniref:DUF4352 domain-containing protein n=1 Tax=Nonomuraea soli TaxID=1032476 RepID=A0A7W0CKD0_9ACTN|nr:hypothetical protein [Nonomuraea soli]MBA2892768.1 hypothetical protein [Nonomuraea soli]
MRRTVALTALAAALTLTGCGLAEEPSTAREPKAAQEPTTAPTATPTVGVQVEEGKAIAGTIADVSAGGQTGKAKLEIMSLKRQGKTTTLNFTVTALDGKVNMHNGMGGHTLDFTVSGVSLIDPVNGKRYRVARNGTDDKAECVCSGTQGMFLAPGDDASGSAYAVFGAPPAEVTKVDVEFPMIGVIHDVPLS